MKQGVIRGDTNHEFKLFPLGNDSFFTGDVKSGYPADGFVNTRGGQVLNFIVVGQMPGCAAVISDQAFGILGSHEAFEFIFELYFQQFFSFIVCMNVHVGVYPRLAAICGFVDDRKFQSAGLQCITAAQPTFSMVNQTVLKKKSSSLKTFAHVDPASAVLQIH